MGGGHVAPRRRRRRRTVEALASREGPGPAARPAARGGAVARRNLCDRTGLRADAAAAAVEPAAGGTGERRDDPERAAEGHAQLRRARGPARSRWRVDELP